MEETFCPMCGGLGAFMGALGYLCWFRCLDCGWEFAAEPEE